jgi:hypothetical protein
VSGNKCASTLTLVPHPAATEGRFDPPRSDLLFARPRASIPRDCRGELRSRHGLTSLYRPLRPFMSPAQEAGVVDPTHYAAYICVTIEANRYIPYHRWHLARPAAGQSQYGHLHRSRIARHTKQEIGGTNLAKARLHCCTDRASLASQSPAGLFLRGTAIWRAAVVSGMWGR